MFRSCLAITSFFYCFLINRCVIILEFVYIFATAIVSSNLVSNHTRSCQIELPLCGCLILLITPMIRPNKTPHTPNNYSSNTKRKGRKNLLLFTNIKYELSTCEPKRSRKDQFSHECLVSGNFFREELVA